MISHTLNKKGSSSFFSKLGFHLPKEHGFSVIFLCSITIGVIMTVFHETNPILLLMTCLFCVAVFFGSTSILETVKSKFKYRKLIPVSVIGGLALIMIWINNFFYNILNFIIISGLFLFWVVLNFIERGHSTQELILGTLTLTYFVPLIYLNASTELLLSNTTFFSLLAIWWLISGFTIQLILFVQYKRRQVSLRFVEVFWIIYLGTLVLLYYFNVLHPLTSILVLEPSLFIINLHRKKSEIPKKLIFKKIGRMLTFRMILYVLLFSLIMFFI